VCSPVDSALPPFLDEHDPKWKPLSRRQNPGNYCRHHPKPEHLRHALRPHHSGRSMAPQNRRRVVWCLIHSSRERRYHNALPRWYNREWAEFNATRGSNPSSAGKADHEWTLRDTHLVTAYFVSIRVHSWFQFRLGPQNQPRMDTNGRAFSRGLLRVYSRAFVVPIPARPQNQPRTDTIGRAFSRGSLRVRSRAFVV